MKIRFTIGLLFWSIVVFAQEKNYADEWIQSLEQPEYKTDELQPNNYKHKYLDYNFSTLLIPRNDFLGYIGSEYQRLKIYFTSINKDSDKADTYHVTGISVVDDNKCEFEGKIKVQQVREYKNMHYGVDNMYEDEGIQAQGIMIGEYEFKENTAQKHTGIFKGVMTLNWYIDKNKILHYDDIERYSDIYRNNQYVGVWKSYQTGIEKVCHWGERRIPFSDDLDIGAGEFSPNPRYYEQGWKDYKIE